MKLTERQKTAYDKLTGFKQSFPMDYIGRLPDFSDMVKEVNVLQNSSELMELTNTVTVTGIHEKRFVKVIDTFGIQTEVDEFKLEFIKVMKVCENKLEEQKC